MTDPHCRIRNPKMKSSNHLAEVIKLPVITKLDIPCDDVLEDAIGRLKEVILVGFDKEGELYFASSVADAGTVLYHFEMAKRMLLDICDN